MDWLLRRYLWIVQAALLAVCAFLVAVTVDTIVGYVLSKKFQLTHPKAVAMRPKNADLLKDYDLINERNVFDAQRENITWTSLADDEMGGGDNWESAGPTSLHVQLVGTAVFDDPRQSLATIVDLGKGSDGVPQTYSINDCPANEEQNSLLQSILDRLAAKNSVPCNKLLGVGQIRRIEENRVYFYNQDRRAYEYVSLEDAKNVPAPTLSKPIASGFGEGVGDIGKIGNSVKETSTNNYDIGQNDLDDALGNLSQISMQARAVPAFDDKGRPIGFKMVSIQPDSVFTKIGLKVNDIITRINGYELNSPDKALEVYQKLRTARNFNIDLKRGDSAITKSYTVR